MTVALWLLTTKLPTGASSVGGVATILWFTDALKKTAHKSVAAGSDMKYLQRLIQIKFAQSACNHTFHLVWHNIVPVLFLETGSKLCAFCCSLHPQLAAFPPRPAMWAFPEARIHLNEACGGTALWGPSDTTTVCGGDNGTTSKRTATRRCRANYLIMKEQFFFIQPVKQNCFQLKTHLRSPTSIK